MPGGAIDFDGSNDGYIAQITGTFGSAMPSIWVSGYLNYDAQVGEKTLAYFLDGSDSTKFAKLTKSTNTLSWTVQSSTGNSRVSSASLAVATWYGFQCYASGPPLSMSVRAWAATTTAGSWGGTADTGTPGFPSNLNNLYVGYNGSTNFLNGRLSHLLVSAFDPTSDAESDAVAEILGKNYTPDAIMSLLFGYLGNAHQYWPMQNAAHNVDIFNGATLSDSVIGSGLGSGTPTTHDSSPRIVIPGRMAA